MKSILILFTGCVLGANAGAQKSLVPASYQPIEEAHGDLDKDGVAEKAVVYNVRKQKDELDAVDRELIIFRKGGGAWTIWQRSLKAVGNSRDGGMMGDPFQELQIKNGVLLLTEAGGSSWKWAHTDKYRYQNGRFELIGYSSHFGRNCDYWIAVDYNIMMGKIEVKKDYEDCGDEEQGAPVVTKRENETFTYRLPRKINLQNRKKAEVKIVSPRYKHEFYL